MNQELELVQYLNNFFPPSISKLIFKKSRWRNKLREEHWKKFHLVVNDIIRGMSIVCRQYMDIKNKDINKWKLKSNLFYRIEEKELSCSYVNCGSVTFAFPKYNKVRVRYFLWKLIKKNL